MTLIRRGHDINGIAGTTLSIIVAIAVAENGFSLGFASISIGLGFTALVCIFVASRISGWVSAGGAFYSSHYRLNTHLNVIFEQQKEHVQLLESRHADLVTRTKKIVDLTFANITNHPYKTLLCYRYFMATFEYLQINSEVRDADIITTLTAELENYCAAKQLNREKLMQDDSQTEEAALLSRMQFIENKAFNALCEKHSNVSKEECSKAVESVKADASTNEPLLASYANKALHQYQACSKKSGFSEDTSANMINSYKREKDTIAKNIESGAHSNGFVPAVHAYSMSKHFTKAIQEENDDGTVKPKPVKSHS